MAKSRATMKSYLILKTDNSAWLLTYEPETKKRTIYAFYIWLVDREPHPAIEPAELWLEHEAEAIEAVYPIDAEKKLIRLDDLAILDAATFFQEIEWDYSSDREELDPKREKECKP